MVQSTHRCTRCETTKSVTEFGKNSRSPSGLKSWCRPCSNAYAREWLAKSPEALRRQREDKARWYEANKDVALDHARAYKKRHKEEIALRKKSAAYRAKERAARRKRMEDRSYRERVANLNKAWQEANPERYRAITRRAGANRRARQRSVLVIPFTREQLDSRLQAFGYRCWMCGGNYEHLDHVKPFKANGPHILANLRPACSACNTAKSGRWYGSSELHQFIKQTD